MLTTPNIVIIAYALPICQLLFYTIQLISFKKSKPARKYLGFLLLCMTVFLIINALYHLGVKSSMTSLYYIYIPVMLMILPLYFLYVSSLTFRVHEIKRLSKLTLFIPSLLVFILNLFTYGVMTSHGRELFPGDEHTLWGSSLQSANSSLVLLWMSFNDYFAGPNRFGSL